MTTFNTENITEDEAVQVYHALCAKFGWAGTIFVREDAENSWNEYHEQEDEFTDELWNKVSNSYYWCDAISDILTERGWDLVHSAVHDALRSEG